MVRIALATDPLVNEQSHGGIGLGGAAVALLKIDDLELAEQILDRAIEVSQQNGRMIALGFASTWRSHVHYHRGHLNDAVTDAERALDLARDGWHWYVSRAVPALAQAHIERGDLNSARAALRRLGNRTAAREPLRRGLELAELFAAYPLAEQAKAELRVAGFRPRRAALSGISSLTPGEHRIIELAARGDSNLEIAQALFVSPKTVKWHLANAFQKLAITSRQQLPAVLR